MPEGMIFWEEVKKRLPRWQGCVEYSNRASAMATAAKAA